jgi:nucleoside-diphosphate-sugar epimerase
MLHHVLRDARGNSAPVETRQHLDSSKDYLHVSDAASGILLAALHGQRGEIYNIASGVALSVQDVAKRLGVRVICTDVNAHPTHSRIAINKAQTELGYRPRYADAGAVVAAIAEE